MRRGPFPFASQCDVAVDEALLECRERGFGTLAGVRQHTSGLCTCARDRLIQQRQELTSIRGARRYVRGDDHACVIVDRNLRVATLLKLFATSHDATSVTAFAASEKRQSSRSHS